MVDLVSQLPSLKLLNVQNQKTALQHNLKQELVMYLLYKHQRV